MIVYEMDDLIKMYQEGTLPEGEKVFRYKASYGLERWIHLDELKIQSGFSNIYPNQKFVDRFSGIINTNHTNKPSNDNTNNS